MTNLEVWYSRLDVEQALDEVEHDDSTELNRVRKGVAKARGKDSLRALERLTETVDGELRFRSEPPLLVPGSELVPGSDGSEVAALLVDVLRAYRETLPSDRQHLLDGYEFHQIARKVVGVGSVGTRAWVVMLIGADDSDPLFLQAKEAEASVLEPYAGASRYRNHGRRVVEGQRLMQAASDIFLGWCHVTGLDGRERDFYVRQLWDWKRSAEVERLSPAGLEVYARMCGWTLARAHARSGDRIAIAAYLGAGEAFDTAIAEFSERYADQSERDHAALVAAIDSDRSRPRTSDRGAQGGRRGRRPDPDDPLRGAVPDDARQLGDERLDRHRRPGRGHDRDRDPDGDHPLHAGDGLVHDHRRQDRPDHRPQTRLRDRLRDLRLRLDDHGAGAEPAGAADRLVGPGGARRCPDPARDRRPRRRQLRPRRKAPCLRPRHRRRGDRGRGRPDRRRLLHHLPLLALRLRRRGPDRARDPRPHPPHRRRRAGAEGAAGPGRHRALRRRPRR